MTDQIPLFVSTLLLTLFVYQGCAYIQRRLALSILNPMLLSILIIIPILLNQGITFGQYMTGGQFFNYLLEPAVVALGFPLYEQLRNIKQQWKVFVSITLLGAIIAVTTSLTFAILVGSESNLAVSMALKSITTPIAIEITQQLNGIVSITALAIIFAGLIGAVVGIRWLKLLGITNPKAQGLAIGAASHVLGTATVSNISFEHGAYSSLSLILSAIFTAIISPWLIPAILLLLN